MLIGFFYVDPSLHPWNEALLIVMKVHFDIFLNVAHQYFVENFHIYIH